jgi:hypothetical protein
MLAGHFTFQPAVPVAEALSRGAALPDRLSAACPIALYGAALQGDSLCLGHYQHEDQALGASRRPWLRRATGGATIRAGEGISYVALALAARSSLMKCPAGRLLNRNVRGVLTGLRNNGVALNYFGRDFLSVGAEPAIYVAWDIRHSGQVLLEFFVAQASAWFVPASELAYPERQEPALRGRTPTTITQLTAAELVRAIADGHARSFAVTWVDDANTSMFDAAPEQLAALHDRAASPALAWSRPREEAIGFVSAGVRLDAHKNFAEVRLAGDFFAHRACPATLQTQLFGRVPKEHEVGEAVDAVFARSGYDVEGIRSLSVIRDAILEAAESCSIERAQGTCE